MLTWLRRRHERQHRARELYGAVVAQARHPDFYTVHGAPDTLEGRYEMIVLHLYLLLDRLQREGEPAAETSRAVTETFVRETDVEMREMGVGDLTVPRKVKRAAAGLFERSSQYRRALADPDRATLERFLEEIVAAPSARGLAGYVRCAQAALATVPAADLLAGSWRFPSPGAREDDHP